MTHLKQCIILLEDAFLIQQNPVYGLSLYKVLHLGNASCLRLEDDTLF